MGSNEVLEFIHKRFPNDCFWLNGNCYYFALILKARFAGTIYYDVIDGHFVCQIDSLKYDWSGVVDEFTEKHQYVKWDEFGKYDPLQKERIVDGCIS